MIVVTVRGLPAPQGSKRHVGNGRMVESSKAVGPWREAVRAETQRVMDTAEPLQGPLWVRLRFTLPRPKGHMGARGLLPSAPVWPAVKPDLDKLARAALDGLVAGGAMSDVSGEGFNLHVLGAGCGVFRTEEMPEVIERHLECFGHG